MSIAPKNKKKKDDMQKMSSSQQPFGKTNYLLIGGCIALIVIGFILMAGPGSSIEDGFNPDIFSTRRIVVGPALSFLGFLLMAFAILYSPVGKKSRQEARNASVATAAPVESMSENPENSAD